MYGVIVNSFFWFFIFANVYGNGCPEYLNNKFVVLILVAIALMQTLNFQQLALSHPTVSYELAGSSESSGNSHESSEVSNGNNSSSAESYNSNNTSARNSTSTEGNSTASQTNSTQTSYQNSTSYSSTDNSESEHDQTTADANSTATTNGNKAYENSTSSSTANQTSTTSDVQSSNVTHSNSTTNQNTTDTDQANYENSTTSSVEQQSNSTEHQSSNSRYSGNTTGTGSQNSTSYSTNSTQIINGNETISSSANMTDSITLNQNTTSLPPPVDFDIDINPITASIQAGSSASYGITVSSLNGFNSDVSLSITSGSIPGITASLSSNMTRPPSNGSTISFLTVQSDPVTQNGEYKLKVTGSSENMTRKSASMTLEVKAKNGTLDKFAQFDPVALTPILIKDVQDNIIDYISSDRMVLISTTVKNNYDKTQPFIIVVEVRDKSDGTTLSLHFLKGILNPLGQAEVGVSWMPEKAGIYEIRAFAINQIKEDPEPLSAIVGKTAEVR